MTTLNTTLLIKVAEAAGLDVPHDVGLLMSGTPFHLLALLEAKSAEWGYWLSHHKDSDCCAMYFWSNDEGDTYWRDYTPTDPISTANAKILCLAEVFGVENDT